LSNERLEVFRADSDRVAHAYVGQLPAFADPVDSDRADPEALRHLPDR